MAITDLSAALKHTSVPEPQLERRDVELAIQHWQRNTWGNDCVPLLDTFDFSPMKTSWGHRFLICGDLSVESSVFVSCGFGFARLLGFPATLAVKILFILTLTAYI